MYGKILLTAMALALAGCGEEEVVDVPPTTQPDARAKAYSPRGKKIARGPNGSRHWFKALASNTHLSPADAFPARVSRFDAEKRCDFETPDEGALVSVVNVYGSYKTTSIYPTTDKLIAENVERLLDRSGNKMLMVLGKTAIVDPFELVNLVITEKSAPVHLVLFSKDQVIWNFVPAEGVEISHVTMFGARDMGVVNLPETVSVTAFDERMMKKCKINPVVAPDPKGSLARHDKRAFAERKAQFARFDNWLRKTHRGISQPHKIEGGSFAHMLIGPAPRTLGERVPYRGIGQAHVRVVSRAPIEISEKEPYAKKIKAMAKEKAQQFVGMSLSAYGREKNKRRN